MSEDRTTYARSIADPEGFWGEQAGLVHWFKKPTRVLDDDQAPRYRWFRGATLNTCYNALDRHVVRGHGDRTALIHDSAVTGVQQLSYAELLERTAAFAGALRGVGVGQGDRVVVWMPDIPEAVIAMLACARLGAVHCVLPSACTAGELAVRIDDVRPAVLVVASCGVGAGGAVLHKPTVDHALDRCAHPPGTVIVKQRAETVAELVEPRDVDWDVVMRAGATDPAESVAVSATDPLYVLCTSDGHGAPSRFVRDNGGHAVATARTSVDVFELREDQVWWTAAELGSVVGHSYGLYAPLTAGATAVLVEPPSGTPERRAVRRVVEQHRVQTIITTPEALRAIRTEDPEGGTPAGGDGPTLRTVFVAEQTPGSDTGNRASGRFGVPSVHHWLHPVTGWPLAVRRHGSGSMPIAAEGWLPVAGYDIEALDEQGRSLPSGTEGALCLKLPLPPGAAIPLRSDEERFVRSVPAAFDGYHPSGMQGYVDDEGYVLVTGSTDRPGLSSPS